MAKRLSAVTGEYTKDGQQKAEWTNVGVLTTGSNGKEYLLLDPAVDLAGVLLKQNVLAAKKGEQPRDMVMTSVFEEQNNNNQGYQNQGYQQQPQQGYQQQGNYNPDGSPMNPQQMQQQMQGGAPNQDVPF